MGRVTSWSNGLFQTDRTMSNELDVDTDPDTDDDNYDDDQDDDKKADANQCRVHGRKRRLVVMRALCTVKQRISVIKTHENMKIGSCRLDMMSNNKQTTQVEQSAILSYFKTSVMSVFRLWSFNL